MNMPITPISTNEINRISHIVAAYQAAIASQIESIRQQKRDALVAAVVSMISELLAQIRNKSCGSELIIAKIYRLLEIVALLGIGDRPEILNLITKIKHVLQIYMRIQLDIGGLLADIRLKGPVHSPKILEQKLAQLFDLVSVIPVGDTKLRFETDPGINLAQFHSESPRNALQKFRSELSSTPMIRKYKKTAMDIMQSLPTSRGFLAVLATLRRRRIVSLIK